jgi:hypothetical protein
MTTFPFLSGSEGYEFKPPAAALAQRRRSEAA